MTGYKVLVVEDSPTMRQLIVFALKRIRGFQIVEANDGVDGLKKLSAEKFDLILTDINMPIMDGYEATDKIREHYKDQQPLIVACTGHTEYNFIQKAWKHQMDEVVEKPANIQVITRILEEAVEFYE